MNEKGLEHSIMYLTENAVVELQLGLKEERLVE